MPIRFQCDHCGQRLSVSRRKAGASAKCPKCKQTINVPHGGDEKPAGDASDDSISGDGPGSFESFEVFESADDWVYEDDDPRQPGRVDPTKVAVPRNIIYMQGVLLGVVALVCFVLGVMIGQLTATKGVAAHRVPAPCEIVGTVTLAREAGALPDIGSVVIALPQNRRPDRNSKLPVDSLGPESALPDRQDPAVLTIRSLGGDYARADANGHFRLRLPDAGKYYLLFVSSNADRGPMETLDRTDLMQMGNYFLYANELLGDNKYQWKGRSIRRDEELNIVF